VVPIVDCAVASVDISVFVMDVVVVIALAVAVAFVALVIFVVGVLNTPDSHTTNQSCSHAAFAC